MRGRLSCVSPAWQELAGDPSSQHQQFGARRRQRWCTAADEVSRIRCIFRSQADSGPSWLRRLYIAIDANFRLKRKKVSSDKNNPSLNHGYAYVVEEKAYKQHLATFDTLPTEQSDHCNNHDAVKLATLKGSVALAATGVASVDCARHEIKRPCSTGDLQKGER